MSDCGQLEFPTVEAVTELVYGDPLHAREREAVIEAIRASAVDGVVDPNRTRPLIPAWVGPRTVSAVYRALIRRRVLTAHGWTTSTDRKGRNAGRPARTYRWNEAAL